MNRNEHTQSLPTIIPAVPERRDLTTALRVAAIIVACAGLFAAGVLSASHVLGLPIACGGSLNCITVALHPSSKVLGIPIAFFGVAAYVVLIYLLGRSDFDRRARFVVFVISALGTIVSTGLLIYSRTVIRATCPWCIASGVAMALLLLFALVLLRLDAKPVAQLRKVTWGIVLLTCLAIGVQAVQMERTASAPPVAAERLAAIPVNELVDSRHNYGPADAPVTVVIFADLLCRPCGRVLGELEKFQQAHPDTFRIVYRHLPFTIVPGHETSKAAAIFSEMAAEMGKFGLFVKAVHAHRGPKNQEVYLDILRILGADPTQAAARLDDTADPAAIRVQRDIALAEQLQIQSTPSILVRVGKRSPISVSQRSLPRVLNSSEVVSLLLASGPEPSRNNSGS